MPMTDEERSALAKKLDDEFQEFLQERIENSKKQSSSVTEDDKSLDELVEELKQHPAFMTEYDPSKPLSPAMEGLQALMYDAGEAEENADSYKDDGNYNFKLKKYRWAINNYTKGITQRCSNKELNAILYSNRAAANYRIGNFRSAYKDAVLALKFKSTHMKALIRVVHCCIDLKRYDEAMLWCDQGYQLSPDEAKFQELRKEATSKKKEHEKELRREKLRERKAQMEESKLLDTIRSRGVKVADSKSPVSCLDMTSVEAHNPAGAKVYLGEDGVLRWPVMFIYPEYTQTDLIAAFKDTDTLADHICSMFNEDNRPSWDTENKYTPDRLSVFFEDKEKEELVKLPTNQALQDILKHDKYVVYGGTPAFILLVEDSDFGKTFISMWKMHLADE